jgi:heptaprenyl diphosphate synthase
MNSFRVSELAKKYTKYNLIEAYTEIPDFPEIRSQILFIFFQRETVLFNKSELFTLVTSLVQLGLDTHDAVPISNDAKNLKDVRSRQLKVLAGDYFSARFYQLLANSGEFDMVRKLSNSICDVNQFKINFYQVIRHLKLSADEYIQHLTEIKSIIFLTFIEMVSAPRRLIWEEIVKEFTKCEILIREWSKLESSKSLFQSWSYFFVFHQANKEERNIWYSEWDDSKFQVLVLKYSVKSELYRRMTNQINLLHRVIQQLESPQLIEELGYVAKLFYPYIQPSIVSEEM